MNKKILYIFILIFILGFLLFLSAKSLAKENSVEARPGMSLNQRTKLYEEEKKSYPFAATLSTFIPGGGHYYINDSEKGIIYSSCEVAFLSGKFIADEEDVKDKALYAFGAVKLIELLDLYFGVDNYNKDLKDKYNLEITYSSEVKLSLNYKF